MRLPRLAIPAFVIAAVLMMVVPIPPALLDVLLAVNIGAAVVILLGVVFLRDSLDFSAFPSLLLVATLVRLALNVTTTRLILLHGYAGKVVQTFGGFVVGGSVVVGLVVFLILIVIQFVVITNGAGRVAEVAARFTLDAMPGRQMAIDADLAAGIIDQEQAKEARARIAREADFYGAMDGASKFVKGDAIAGIVIVAINLIGGFAIGMGMHGMTLQEAIGTYSLLSVGDGLVSQIPALLISISTGLIVTRVGGEEDLAQQLGAQLLRHRDAVRTAGFVVLGMALLPGLPKPPFAALGALLLLAAGRADRPDHRPEEAPTPTVAPSPDDPEALMSEIRVDPLELHLAYDVLDLIDEQHGGDLLKRVRALRRQIAAELGYVMPLVRTRDDVSLPEGAYRILLHGVEVGSGRAPRGRALALPFEGGGESLRSLGGEETVEPVFGLAAYWIPESARAEAATMGATVVDRASVIVTHLAEVARRHAPELLSRQDVQGLVESLRYDEPLLANEVGSDHLPLSTLHAVLRGLLAEQVSIRDLARIVEAVSQRARETRSVEQLVAAARVALGPAILARVAPGGVLGVVTLEAQLEALLHEGLREVDGEIHLVTDPSLAERLRDEVASVLERPHAEPVAVVVGQALRRPLARLLAAAGLEVPVLAYPELPPKVRLVSKGVIGHVQAPAPA
ncbi:MAG: flagellar biosynthesis protein FlhA [Actinomycetota bacterium]|nr:MAG: flagellar biosynthesis protein FlhA [Actinomycetota bacterium]